MASILKRMAGKTSRRMFFFVYMCFFTFSLEIDAQAPVGFNYQAVVRDHQGTVMAGKGVSFRITLIEGGISGTEVYSEIHETKTSDLGLVNLVIGKGSYVSSPFESIEWTGKMYIKVELDMEKSGEFDMMGITQLMSVPYAMFAEKSGDGLTTGEQIVQGKKTFTSPIKGTIDGGVILSGNVPATAGAMRWNGKDFQGYNGREWISLTAGGGSVATDTTSWTCGDTLIDLRNGEVYRTVLLGNQCWMQDNLNFEIPIGSFEGTGEYAPENAGLYYNWAGMMAIDSSYNHKEYSSKSTYHRGVCPQGWHLPTHEDFIELESMEGITGISLLEGGGSGFEAKLAGDRLKDGSFANVGLAAVFWTSSEFSAYDAWKRILFEGEEGIGIFVIEKTHGFSVRCIKD
jgi:uncharacterized protein (TIGR02145 family)